MTEAEHKPSRAAGIKKRGTVVTGSGPPSVQTAEARNDLNSWILWKCQFLPETKIILTDHCFVRSRTVPPITFRAPVWREAAQNAPPHSRLHREAEDTCQTGQAPHACNRRPGMYWVAGVGPDSDATERTAVPWIIDTKRTTTRAGPLGLLTSHTLAPLPPLEQTPVSLSFPGTATLTWRASGPSITDTSVLRISSHATGLPSRTTVFICIHEFSISQTFWS